jgi:phosphohistidine phosphatase
VRYLTIVRHAKAVAAEPGQSDFERPLTAKGRAQAEQLRTWVNDRHELGRYGPTTALVSAAARTRETYAVAFAGTAFVHAVETSELIYNGRHEVSAEDLLFQLSSIDPVSESLLVVGHNPTVLELALTLSKDPVPALARGKFPLGAAIVLGIDKHQPIGLRHYDYVAQFVPDV